MMIDYNKIDCFPAGYHSQPRIDMLRYLPKDASKILDIGCGEGAFGKLIKEQRSAEIWGIELFPQAAEKATARLDRVFVGNIETGQFNLPEEYFDCIVFNDVLEHLYYPWNVLRLVKKFLNSNGHVMASIPNIRQYGQVKKLVLQGEWDYENSGLMDRTHIRCFTYNSIGKMFKDCGYVDIKVEGIECVVFSWKFKLLNRLFGGRLDDMKYLQFACLAKPGR